MGASLTALWERHGGSVYSYGGDWKKATCIFHQDRTPSASVNEHLGKWKCRTCDLSGDAIDIVRQKERLSFMEAKEWLAREVDSGALNEGGSGECDSRVSGSSQWKGDGVSSKSGSRPGRRNWSPPWKR